MRDWQAFVRSRLALEDLTPEREARIVRELAGQLEDFYQDGVAGGLDHDAAEAHAAAQIADWRRMSADVRRADRAHRRPRVDRLSDRFDVPTSSTTFPGRMLMNTFRDVRYVIRQLARTPGFTFVAMLTLALGIGATTAIFSVVNGVLLRPLPYADPDGLVRVHEIVPQYGRFSVAPANFLDWRQQNRVFDRIAAYTTTSGTFTDGDVPERVQGASVSWDLFELLGVLPAVGGSFTAAHDAPGADDVILISQGLWQRRFGGDPGAVGRTITVNGAPVTILGVMPSDFYFPNRTAEFWEPIALDPANAPRGAHYIGVVARLENGVSPMDAGTEMKAIALRLAAEYPDSNANESAEVVPLLEQVVGLVRPALVTLLAAVSVVVLIACANVANLLLVRASVREREVAIRAALGAARRRLVAQMLAESLVLAAIGGALGLLLAYLAVPMVQSLGAGSIPRVTDVVVDGRVLGFALAVSLATGLLFGLAPAWHASRAGIGGVIKEGGRSSTSTGGRWIRHTLLVAEVALSIILLVGATLLLRSFARLTNVDPGFQPERVLAFQVSLPRSSYPEEGNRITFFGQLLDAVASAPGVTAAGMVQTLPLKGSYVLSVAVEGQPPAKPGEGASANYRVASPDYFAALGIPVRMGRAFASADTETSLRVAVVDEAFVKRHFPDEDPIGRGLAIGNGSDAVYRIVGVVGNVRQSGLDAAPAPAMYVPYRQDVFSTMWVVTRTDGDPLQLAGVVRQAVRALDRSLPAYSLASLETILSESVAEQRFSMLLLVLFAGVALFLSAVGLYGVVAYSVSQRTREIGLRMAIGARPGDVLRLVVGEGMKWATAGVALGLAGAIVLSRLVETMLFEVAPSDPVSYAGTALLLLVVAGVACYVPARRALRVDPLTALQAE